MKNFKLIAIFACIQLTMFHANSADSDSTQRFTDSQAKERAHVHGGGHALVDSPSQTRRRGISEELAPNSADSDDAEPSSRGVAGGARGASSQAPKPRSGKKILRFNAPD
jgi:hypothetical protein